ncbi:MAG TPA: dihydrofolate reductase [Candidatus Paceibacterota bacterium]|nr:dihydrofolate reductase [Candidatus Paceibacterota bacterium]
MISNTSSDSVVAIIAAYAKVGRAIGLGGQIPWHLRDDLQRFKKLTQGHPIIMGRKTHESIGKVLPDRTNIVVSRRPEFHPASPAVLAENINAAIALARTSEGADLVFVIGGGEIYREALPLVDRLYLTEVDGDFPGDAFFPLLDETWEEVFREEHVPDENNPHPFRYFEYERRKAA